MTNPNFIKEFFLIIMMRSHTCNAACRVVESLFFFSFALSFVAPKICAAATRNETPIAFRLCEDRFSLEPASLTRFDVSRLSNSEDPHTTRTEAELHARWFVLENSTIGVRLGAYFEKEAESESAFALNSPAITFSRRTETSQTLSLTTRAELEFENAKRSILGVNAVYAPTPNSLAVLAGLGLTPSGELLTQFGFRAPLSTESRWAIEGAHYSRGSASFTRITLHIDSFSILAQAPIAWAHPEETHEYAIRIGYAFGLNEPPATADRTPTESRAAVSLSATVVQSQPAYHLFMIDRGSESQVEVGQEFDVYDSGSVSDRKNETPPIARAHVSHLQNTRAILSIDEYRAQKTIEEGFIVRASSSNRIAAPKLPLLR